MTCPLTSDEVRDYPFGDRADLNIDPTYAELRAHQPVARVRMPYGGEAWLLTRYEDIRKALTDPRLSMHAAADWDAPRATVRPNDSNGLMGMPQDDHSRLRRIVSKAFTARRVARMRPAVEQITGALVDRMIAAGRPADLVQHLALPLPTTVICRMLGVPESDESVFRRFNDALMSSTRYSEDEIATAMHDFSDYLRDLAARRRAEPQDDLLSALIQVSDDDGALTENELLMLTGGLLLGGHETTANQLTGHILLLLTERARYERLCTEPQLIPQAVEELLRFVPLWTSVGPSRVATEDVDIGGTVIPAGDAVVYSLTAANRDGDVFENPDEFCPAREPNQHLNFGHGPHYCVGAPLARLELQCALESLVHRLPELRLSVPEEDIDWHSGMQVRGVEKLPVTW